MKIEVIGTEELGEGAWLTIEEGQAYYMPGKMIILDCDGSTMKITWDESEPDEIEMAAHMERVMAEVANEAIKSACFNKTKGRHC